MNTDRRGFLKTGALALLATALAPGRAHGSAQTPIFGPKTRRGEHLQPGDTVGLIAPASLVNPPDDVTLSKEIFEALGFRVKIGDHVLDRYGHLAGKDRDRAADIHRFVRDPEVKALISIRGGWGCQRVLPYLDFDLIGANPKIFMGYSDVTTLLNAIYAKTGLVTFHGPVGISTFSEFTLHSLRAVLMQAEEPVVFENPPKDENDLVETENRVVRFQGGTAEGRLIGGNLSLMAALVGTPFEPDYKNAILFLEEVGEKTYSIDRMLAQLQQAGHLEKLSGIVVGKFSKCKPQEGYGAFSVEELLRHYFEPLGIPAYMGAMIGHITDKWTVPVGARARLDADKARLLLLESPVR